MLDQKQFTLKQLRGLSGLSQKELASRVGVSDKTIQNYENGHAALSDAPYSRIKAIAKALDVSVDDIFLEHTSEKPN